NDIEVEHGEKNLPSSQLADFGGRYYQFKGLSREPRPIQKPHPPVYIGSWGSRAGLKRVAKYGDGWMASAYNITPEKFKERWKTLLSYRRSNSKDTESFQNSMMSMFGYIDNDKEKVHRMVKNILSPALGRPTEDLETLLLFGSVEHCINKIDTLRNVGVKRIHFWPINDFNEQIEIFSKEVASKY
ncbi:MAG: LLM class flavin-dependent oxidoreductase, partial [Nitrososphaeraceae archaeon]